MNQLVPHNNHAKLGGVAGGVVAVVALFVLIRKLVK